MGTIARASKYNDGSSTPGTTVARQDQGQRTTVDFRQRQVQVLVETLMYARKLHASYDCIHRDAAQYTAWSLAMKLH
jgi:hypothetical protein